MASAGTYRRNGKRDFCEGLSPEDCYRGRVGSFNYQNYCDGWKEEEEERSQNYKTCSDEGGGEIVDCRFNDIRSTISDLAADPQLTSILESIVDLLEEIKDGSNACR